MVCMRAHGMATFLALLVFALGLTTASRTAAQSLRPSAASWSAAEQVLRAHYAASSRTIVEVTPQRDRALGTAFWVRFGDGGGLVAVRGDDVIDAPGSASVAAILRADDALAAHRWTAADLLYLCTSFGAPPPLARAPISGGAVRVLEPTLGYGRYGATLVVYAHRDGPPEAPAHRAYYVQRAIGRLDERGVITWTVSDVVLDLRGRERLVRGAERPSMYDACRACTAQGESCAECTRRSCRTCLEHAEVLTDPSFCLPRCRPPDDDAHGH